MLRALWTRFQVSCRKWLMIELRVRPLIMLWLAAASEQVNLVILVDNLEVLLWRLLLSPKRGGRASASACAFVVLMRHRRRVRLTPVSILPRLDL